MWPKCDVCGEEAQIGFIGAAGIRRCQPCYIKSTESYEASEALLEAYHATRE